MVVCWGTDETTSRDAAWRLGSRSYQWSLLAPDGFALRSAKLGSVPSAYYSCRKKVPRRLTCALYALVSVCDYPQFHFFGLTSAWLLSDDVCEGAS